MSSNQYPYNRVTKVLLAAADRAERIGMTYNPPDHLKRPASLLKTDGYLTNGPTSGVVMTDKGRKLHKAIKEIRA